VFPTRSYLAQRNAVNDARNDVQVLQEQNRRLQEEADRLETPEEIERLAREEFQMVYPGERAYAVLPAPAATTTTAP
jgi:cell division protein FtsB